MSNPGSSNKSQNVETSSNQKGQQMNSNKYRPSFFTDHQQKSDEVDTKTQINEAITQKEEISTDKHDKNNHK